MRALELLSKGIAVEQIAGRLGFSSTAAAAFGHAFRRDFGITPGELRSRIDQGEG